MRWRDFFGGVGIAFAVLFAGSFVLIALAIAAFAVYEWLFASVVPTPEMLYSWVGDTVLASVLLGGFWAVYAAIRLLFDPEDSPLGSPLGRGSRGVRVRSPPGELATATARNSRPKCVLGLVFFVVVAAVGLLIVSSAEALFYVAGGWLCLLVGVLFSLLYAFKLFDRRPQVTVGEHGVGLGPFFSIRWDEIRTVDDFEKHRIRLTLREPGAWRSRRSRWWGWPFRFDGEALTITTALLDTRRRELAELMKRRHMRHTLGQAEPAEAESWRGGFRAWRRGRSSRD